MKSVVSKRNEFESAGELVEIALVRLPDELKHPNFRAWCLRYTEMVVKYVASGFAKGATRGIEQAANLICDPEFYETKKSRRTRQTKAQAEANAQMQWEAVQRRECPTPEQAEQEIKSIHSYIEYHQEEIAKQEKRLAKLQAGMPQLSTSQARSLQ